jgi:hypothetical protein
MSAVPGGGIGNGGQPVATPIKWLVTLAVAVSTVAPPAPSFAQDIFVDAHGVVHISQARAAALRYCNWIARDFYPDVENDHNRDSYYRACMAAHGQLE